MRISPLLMSLLAIMLPLADTRTYYYYYYEQPNSDQVSYQTEYILMRTNFGTYYYQPVQVPIPKPTPSITTTTKTTPRPTTTTPRPPPSVSTPTGFFYYCNDLPMILYSNLLCGVFSLSGSYVPNGKRNIEQRSTQKEFKKPVKLLNENETFVVKDELSNLNLVKGRSVVSNKQTQYDKREGLPEFYYVEDVKEWIVDSLLKCTSRDILRQFKDFLNSISLEHIGYLVDLVYGNKISLTDQAVTKLRMWYVSDPNSSPSWLADADEKTLLIDLLLILNCQEVCDRYGCGIKFGSVAEIVDAMHKILLPPGMDEVQAKRASQAIAILSNAKLSQSNVSNLFKGFVDEYKSKNNNSVDVLVESRRQYEDSVEDDGSDDKSNESSEDEEKEYYLPHSAFLSGNNGPGKRSISYQPAFDKQMTCYVLSNYIRSSSYCGVIRAASQLYINLQCHTVSSPVVIQPNPRNPTSTTTTTTTTTSKPPAISTPPATTTRSPTTTTTRSPTTITTRSPTTATTRSPPATITNSPTTTTTTTALPTTSSTPVQCGISNIATRSAQVSTSSLLVTPRVIGGRMVGTCTAYPWMVELIVNGRAICGGAMIDRRHILTAAHCVEYAMSAKVTVGQYDRSQVEGTEQVFNIDPDNAIHIHPEYNSFQKKNDVAILVTDSDIDTDQICALPVCLETAHNFTSGESCQVTGWGKISENSQTASTTLQEATVSTFQGTECAKVFPNAGVNYLTDPTKQLCAGNPTVGGVDSCEGDSGGPLVCFDKPTGSWYLRGLVSYGQGCGSNIYPGVYTHISTHLDWIHSITGV